MKAPATIWEMLVDSGLITSSRVSEIRTRYEDEAAVEDRQNPNSILHWLKERKRISRFQMQVLAGGLPGPFRFDQYQIHALEASGPLAGSYRGIHLPSNHSVRIFFFGGSTERDARTWAQICQYVAPRKSIANPFLKRLYETVEVAEYRLVVAEFRVGQPLTQKLPDKARLPWPQTCQAAEQLALGLAEIHRSGYSHDRIWPGAIWLQRGGNCQLMWQVPGIDYDPQRTEPDQTTLADRFVSPFAKPSAPAGEIRKRQRQDLYSLGAVIFRLISGRSPKIKSHFIEQRNAEVAKHIAACEKYEIPESVQQVLRLLLTADLNEDLKDAGVAARLIGSILESQSIVADVEPPPDCLEEYLQALEQKTRSLQFVDRLESLNGDLPPFSAAAGDEGDHPGFDHLETAKPGISSRERIQKRQTRARRGPLPLIWGAGILVAAVSLGLVLGGAFSEDPATAEKGRGSETGTDTVTVDEPREVVDGAPAVAEPQPVVFRPQTVLEDDGELPWQSPTGAAPLDVSFIPAAPEFLFSFRPQHLSESVQAQRFIRSLGPRFAALQGLLESLTGRSWTDFSRLTVSLHATPQRQMHAFVVAELGTPLDPDKLREDMGQPESAVHAASDTTIFTLPGARAFFVSRDQQVATIVLGQGELIDQSLESSGIAMAGRTMSGLLGRSDRDRDVNVLFRNAALLSEEGGWLFAGELQNLRRPLHLFFDDRIQGALFSLHFDRGTYLELMTEQSRDLENRELVEVLPQMLRTARDRLNNFVSRLPAHPHWSSVQQRFDNMLNELVRNTRVGQEPSGVVANCWLPESAAHNLVAAGELVLHASEFDSASAEVTTTGPQTLDQLLATPRDLLVTTNPDLINLLRDIEQEVRDDFPNLPFEFRIKMLGSDLAVEGITQNQRPGQVEASQVPLGDILARIMLQANPDKSATRPSDPACKLVWLIGPDPAAPDKKVVLITTRTAARTRGLTLPKVFQTE